MVGGRARIACSLLTVAVLTLALSSVSQGLAGAQTGSPATWTPTYAPAPAPVAPLPDGGGIAAWGLNGTDCVSSSFCLSLGYVRSTITTNQFGPTEESYWPLAETYIGDMWVPQTLPLPPAMPSFTIALLQSVSCFDVNTCAVIGYVDIPDQSGDYHQNTLLEIDQGGTWSAQEEQPVPGFLSEPFGVACAIHQRLEDADIESKCKTQRPTTNGDLFTKERFEIDLENDTVACSAGVRVNIVRNNDGGGLAYFAEHSPR